MDERRRRIRFRAWRRGFREMDLVMGAFADAHLDELDEEGLAEFERLLEQPDQDVFAWLIGRIEPPPAFDGPTFRLIKSFRYFARTAHAGREG